MNMKKILQAVDGISARPVKGADSMARFLRVVKEAEINQPVGLPAVTPIKVPPIPQLPAQDGDQGNGSSLTTNPDGTKTYAGGFGRFTYDAQGKAIKYDEPQFTGLGRSIDLTTGQTTQNYNAGPLNTTQTTDAKGNVVSHNTEYDVGVGKMAMGRDAKGITSKSWQGRGEEAQGVVSNKDLYAMGNKDKEATYNRAMAQVNATPANEDYNSMKRFLNVVSETTLSRQVYLGGYGTEYLQQIVVSNRVKDGITPQQALAELKTRVGSGDPHNPAPSPEFVKKYLSKRLEEGANPHKVALPVQMAMQHYQQVKEIPQPRERLIDKYFVEAETDLTQRREEKRALINQYAKTIAERVLMKESAQGVAEGSDPNKLAASVTVDGEFKEFDLTPLIAKNNWVGTPKQIINLADTYLGDFFRKRGSAYSNLKLTYKGMTLNANQVGDVGSPDPEFESIAEAPIAMDPAEPNNPTIHNHQKANTMSLKGRIASARAQLQELAELSESNSLLAWEQICKKAKGGMFMGLEQNLEQIRHGIEELAKQRRKGGTSSRGIDKHIGEGKRK